MLGGIGILTGAELAAIEAGLARIRAELRDGTFVAVAGDEDIHMAVERRLVELVGAPGAKLHTARSRNDQVALDLRLATREAIGWLVEGLVACQEVLVHRAQEHRRSLMPGYTHLQRAQPVTLAHHLLAYFEMLQRDVDRLLDAAARVAVSPLGAGALAGTTLPINRAQVARELGLAQVAANSLDAVADRDFAVEAIACCALIGVHTSRLGEELVLWCSAEFGYVHLPDAWATGSSLMPQKKNPDVFELLRGRSGRATGALVTVLTVLKGLPLAYNRDLQEVTRPLLDTMAATTEDLRILAEVLAVLEFDIERMAAAARDPFLLATDVADYLVLKGVPFREAHGIVGRAVRLALRTGRGLDALELAEWQELAPAADAELATVFDPERVLRRREVPGAPGPRSQARALLRAGLMVRRNRRALALLRVPPGA